MIALVGNTGFVGSNISASAGVQIDAAYHSANIREAYGTNPDLLIYAGLRAEKYLANHEPEKDMDQILQAEENILAIRPKKLVLISTIDVFKSPIGTDENTAVDTDHLHAYGYNRYLLEQWTRERYPDALIIRLPGLFGINLKKNFIYDFINYIPFMINQEKMLELSSRVPELKEAYQLEENGFYRLIEPDPAQREHLKMLFRTLGFSALNFTDSRSVYQFYPLKRLWGDIQIALKENITLFHPATQPVSAGEVYQYLTGDVFVNELSGKPAFYDFRTKYDRLFGGMNGYICDKESILKEIMEFATYGK